MWQHNGGVYGFRTYVEKCLIHFEEVKQNQETNEKNNKSYITDLSFRHVT